MVSGAAISFQECSFTPKCPPPNLPRAEALDGSGVTRGPVGQRSPLQFVFGDFGKLRQMAQKAGFESAVSMHRNRQSYDRCVVAVDVVAAVDSQQNPTVPFDNSAEFFPRGLLQTAISIIREDFSSAE